MKTRENGKRRFRVDSPQDGQVSFLTLARVPFLTILGGAVRNSLELPKELLVPNSRRYRAPGEGAWGVQEGRWWLEEGEEGERRTSWRREGIMEGEPL